MRVYNVHGARFVSHKNSFICIDPICLDIETSNNHADDPKELITWISSIQVLFRDEYHLFRTPEELIDFYLGLIDKYELADKGSFKRGKKMITFIHNSSYDLSYLIPYFIKYLPDFNINDQGLIEDSNKYLTYIQGCFEWRCSYRLTNMSLERWSKEMNVEHQKQIGLYDYEKIIYQDDDLDLNSQIYDKYDVLALNESLSKQNEYHHDNLATMPLTMTGYVRRELRNSCKKSSTYRSRYFNKSKMSPDLYQACLRSYAGGMTHNNRFFRDLVIQIGKTYSYCGKKIRVTAIKHRDFKSHYPSQLRCYKMPIGRPHLIFDVSKIPEPMSIDDILKLSPRFSTISIIRFKYACIKDISISFPFMQFSKCRFGSYDMTRLDNGRVLKARGEWYMSLDNLTLKILNEQYDLIDYEVLKVWKFANGYLPAELSDVIDRYFKGKSDHKNRVNELIKEKGKLDPETVSANFDLMQTKILLNSIYGCLSTNPIRDKWTLDKDMNFRLNNSDDPDEDEVVRIARELNRYYSSRNSFLPYIIGIFTTARARYELYEYIKTIGYSHVLYVDTDSAFYISNKTIEKKIEALNAKKRKTASYVILDNGTKEYYDSFELEPDCIAFKGLHSKCYGCVTDKGLLLTIAGIPARTLIGLDDDNKPIYLTREDELRDGEPDDIKALDKLRDNVEFKVNTGSSALLVGATGKDTDRIPQYVNVNGHIVSTAGGIVIRRLSKKLVKPLKGMDDTFDLNE